jgi:glycosyltransferase involved in cell wall biosynthesis
MRISIITLALDTPRFFDEAVGSINAKGPFELEHIVVHDGDDAFVRDIERRYPAIKIVKGEGAGATAAASRGIEAATGDFILFLHSDDRVDPAAFGCLVECATARPEVKIWTGAARIFRTGNDGSEATVRWLIDRETTRLSIENVCDDIPLLTARFCHRSVYAEVGNFDPEFSESSDREFLLRVLMAGIVEAPLGVMVSEMRQHDGSRTIHSRAAWVPPYFIEHVRLAGAWLTRSGLSRGQQRFLRNWRAREILRLCLYQCRAGQWRATASLLIRAELTDPLWIFRIATVITSRQRRLRNDNPEMPKICSSRSAASKG